VAKPESKQNVYSIKGDYAFSDKNRISGLYSRFYSPGIGQIGPVPGFPAQTGAMISKYGTTVSITIM